MLWPEGKFVALYRWRAIFARGAERATLRLGRQSICAVARGRAASGGRSKHYAKGKVDKTEGKDSGTVFQLCWKVV